MDSQHSVSVHIANLKHGQDVSRAQQFIFDRYFQRLASLAQKRLSGAASRAVTGEDIAISVLAKFFDKVSSGTAFPNLQNRQNLWPLLATIAQRKAITVFQRELRKHFDGRLRGESVLEMATDGQQRRLDEIVAGELTPASADEVFQQCGGILDELRDHDERFDPPATRYHEIAVLILQGFTTTEIANSLGYKNKKTVERAIDEIRIIWKCLGGGLATVHVSSDTDSFQTTLSTEPLILGRRRKGEPEPIWDGLFNVDGVSTRRLILTTDPHMSRNHCQVKVHNEISFVVTNTSRKSEIVLDSALVPPGSSQSTSGDCQLRLPGFSIWLRVN